MRLVIIEDSGKIKAEFDSKEIKEKLIGYFNKYDDLSEAYDQLEKDLKKLITTR